MDDHRPNFTTLVLTLFFTFIVTLTGYVSGDEAVFDSSYRVSWGQENVVIYDGGREVQISLDAHSGSGFESKESYGSGFFHMRLKLHNGYTAGVVTTFYLISDGNNHDELDFEFLGNVEGKPVTLQTNVFANGVGNREQKIHLWFDPATDFHSYKILWNNHIVVFYVDDTPIRVFKNNNQIGVAYPTQPSKVKATIWDGSDWATDGGRIKVNYSYAPFETEYRDFRIVGCPSSSSGSSQNCYGSGYWWNRERYRRLDSAQKRQYEDVRKKYLVYDYCSDRNRYPNTPSECASNS